MTSLSTHAPDMTPEQAHKYICDKYGTKVLDDKTPTQLWGGKGCYVIDTDGSRKFDDKRDEMNRLGKENGCHTCGRYKGEDTPPNANTGQPMQNWVCDHQPPLGIIGDADVWQLYAQCHDCSNLQHGQSIVYKNAFYKHVGRYPDKRDQHLFWGAGRPHRTNANYGSMSK